MGNNSVWNLIQDLGEKKGINEIVINSPQAVFVERDGQFIQLKVHLNKGDIYDFISEIAKFNKKECNQTNPILDGSLPDGSRINIVLEPYVQNSPAITIRRYIKSLKSFETSPNIFGLSPRWIQFLKSLIHGKANIIVAGGTGVGKTTFLNLLLNELSPSERIVTIEDTIELDLTIPNQVRLEARGKGDNNLGLSIRELVKNTLRMRPDRIIIGEVRGEELFDLLQAMNTGHDGSMSSIHANSPFESLSRMETLFLLAGYDVPIKVVRKQISTGLNFIIQLSRSKKGERIVSQISEVTGMEGDTILLQHIALHEDEVLRETGITPKILQKLHSVGNLPIDFFKDS